MADSNRANYKDLVGSGVVLAGVQGKKIQVFGLVIIVKTAMDVYFTSSSGTQISMTLPLDANGGAVFPQGPYPWMETLSGEGLSLVASTPGVIGVQFSYNLA